MTELDRVRQARQTDLSAWLRQNNVPLKRAGQWWYIEGCDSLRIQGNKWYRNSQDKGGNSIDFLVSYYGLSPKEAINRLTHTTADCYVTEKCGVKEKNMAAHPITSAGFDFKSITPAHDQRRVLAYLSKTRGIPADTVMAEIRRGALLQESRTGNAVFAITNETGAIVGAEVVGTLSFDNAHFKGLKASSASGYGYNVGQRQSPRYILYFESAVDMLSFITIMRGRAKPLTECLLVSMAGLKFTVIQKTLQVFGNLTAIPVLCTDNDLPGAKFNARCLAQLPSAILNLPDRIYKDWNDQLLKRIVRLE